MLKYVFLASWYFRAWVGFSLFSLPSLVIVFRRYRRFSFHYGFDFSEVLVLGILALLAYDIALVSASAILSSSWVGILVLGPSKIDLFLKIAKFAGFKQFKQFGELLKIVILSTSDFWKSSQLAILVSNRLGF